LAPSGEYRQSVTAPPAGTTPIVLRRVARRLSVVQWLVLSVLVVLVSTALLFEQQPWSHVSSYRPGARSWWFEPIEWNSIRRLPDIKGNINAVTIQPGSSRVWIAGDAGLLAFSDDSGDQWTQLEYNPLAGMFIDPSWSGNISPWSSILHPSSRVEAATLSAVDARAPAENSLTPQSVSTPKSDAPSTDSNAQTYPNQQNPIPVQQSPIQQTQLPVPPSKLSPPPGDQIKMYNVPTVLGLSLGAAEKTLLSANLRLGKISKAFSVSEVGNVTAQYPAPAVRVPFGTPIDLVVGENSTSVSPNPKVDINTNANTTETGKGKKGVGTSTSASTEDPANWSAPNLLFFTYQNKGTSISVLGADGRAFITSDSGRRWIGQLSTPLQSSVAGKFAAVFMPNYIVSKLFGDGTYTLPFQTDPKVEYMSWPFHIMAGHAAIIPGIPRVLSYLDGIAPGFKSRSLWFSSKEAGCVAGYDTSGGKIYCTNDARKNWTTPITKLTDHLEDVNFGDDSTVGWAVGANGVVLWTNDHGQHWQAKTQSAALDMLPSGMPAPGKDWWRLLPRWFYAAWMFGLLFAAMAPFAVEKEAPVKFIQDYAASDRPLDRGDRDALDFTPLAKSLSAFVRNAATKPPLTISIDGPWGSGKSSLMNLMCADLREFGFRAVWFNAWHNQKEEHLLAALLQTVRLEAVPQLWDPTGIGFRIRLVGNRVKRYWFPMMLVIGLALLLFLLDYSHTQHSGHSLLVDVPRLLPNWVGGTGKKSGGLFARLNRWPSLGTLLGLAALWPVVKKLLQAFGTNPAALLATIGQGNRIADLDAQTSFRDKFAKEFRDVTQALGEDHQLVVFIDDLDRCRPENVRDVLEAVNFLVSSGGCFVVMGLERKSVEAALGLSMKEMAAQMAGIIDEKDFKIIEARRQYASHFLDKLINLEVPIPQLDQNKARGLFCDVPPDASLDKAKVDALLRQRARAKRAEKWAHYADSAVRFAFGFIVSATLLFAAYNGGLRLEQVARETASTPTPGKAAETVGISPALPAPDAGKPQAAGPPSGEAATKPPTPSAPPPEIHPGSNARPAPWKLSWPELVTLAIMATIAYYALTQAGKGARHDSEKFVEALNIWYPLVISRQPTPRAVKRWMNRVRYLATRELPSSELRTPMERFADWYATLGEEKSDAVGGEPAKKSDQKDSVRIPEEIVVALAAISEFDPKALMTPANFLVLQDPGQTSGLSTLGISFDLLIEGKRRMHMENANFTSWDQIALYTPRFLALWPKIDIQ
jgi:KAP-like P-loop domain-containing protein/PASTA domain-containing protein